MADTHASKTGDDLTADARRLFQELDRSVPGLAQTAGECRPPLDIVDTAAGIEVVMDLPGVKASAVRVCVRHNMVVVVGVKVAPPTPPDARYHVAERSSGRFVRGVRLSGAVDAGRGHARVVGGLLRITLPRLDDRRGLPIDIPVSAT